MNKNKTKLQFLEHLFVVKLFTCNVSKTNSKTIDSKNRVKLK